MLVDNMLEDSNFGHLFLSIKKFKDKKFVAIDPIWFKKNTNWANLPSKNFLRDMAAIAGFVGNFINKLGRVIGIIRMCAWSVPLKIIASNTGYKNLNIIKRY